MSTKTVTADTQSSAVHIFTRRVQSWDAAKRELDYFDGDWIFRGQRNAAWDLRCNLDRLRGDSDPVDAEARVVQEFKQRAHLFLQTREPEGNLEWLALLQHHGGPTRLLDFTRSPLMAAFFALEEEGTEDYCSVWAIDELACRRRAVERLRAIDPEYSWLREHHDITQVVEDQLQRRPPIRFAAPVQPLRLNSRMALQQGVFLCLGDPGTDVISNLNVDVEDEKPLRIVKVEFPRAERGDALASLRLVNISVRVSSQGWTVWPSPWHMAYSRRIRVGWQ